MIRTLFLDHPADVNESYPAHFRTATRFGLLMIAGGLAAIVHGFVPALFQTTGSRTVKRLHAEMNGARGRTHDANVEMKSVEWVI